MSSNNPTTAGACWKRDDICFGTSRCVAGQSCEADYPSADNSPTTDAPWCILCGQRHPTDSACGRDFHAPDGSWLASIVPHPRLTGHWLAMLCDDLTTRDKPSGWYRYKTFRGAVALVENKIASASKIPVDKSA